MDARPDNRYRKRQGLDPVIEVDRSGRIVAADASADDLASAIHGRSDTADPTLLRLADPPPEGLDRELELADGRRVTIRAVRHPDRPDRALLAVRDVTERADLESELHAARRAAAVARLAGAVAHEINNPLTVLQLRTDLLLEEPALPAPLRDQVAVLRDSAARIARTVRALQRIGRPARPGTEWIAIGDLVASAVAALRSQPGGWSGAGKVEVGPVPAIGIRGDPDALGLALEQILVHACDPSGGQIAVSLDRGRVRIEVRTEMPRWAAGPVVDPNAEVDDAVAPDRLPSLGLSVAASIAAQHGGELVGLLTPPGGALRLELPIAPNRGRARPLRVLVVHDDERVGALVAGWGRRGGHEVLVARDEDHAEQVVGADPRVDLVLADPDRLEPLSARLAPRPVEPRPRSRAAFSALLDRLAAP